MTFLISLGLGHVVAGDLGGLVGVQRPLVVGASARVEILPRQLGVEVLQLHAQGRDVLESQLLDRLELGLLARQGLAAAGPRRSHRQHDPDNQDA